MFDAEQLLSKEEYEKWQADGCPDLKVRISVTRVERPVPEAKADWRERFTYRVRRFFNSPYWDDGKEKPMFFFLQPIELFGRMYLKFVKKEGN